MFIRLWNPERFSIPVHGITTLLREETTYNFLFWHNNRVFAQNSKILRFSDYEHIFIVYNLKRLFIVSTMRANAGIFIIIFLLFLVGTVEAVGIPDTVSISTDKPWIVANNADQSTITIYVTNTTPGYSGSVPGASITLLVNDNALGTLDPQTVTTDSGGYATTIFKVKTKSGAAQITALGLSGSGIQNIDHGSAYHVVFTHPLSGTVATLVPFNVSITDQYGNPVDNRRGNHIISLHVTGPAPDDCGFNEAGVQNIFLTLDANGMTSVNIRLTSRIGENNILMDGYESIPNQLEWITADTNGVPFSITQVVSPPGNPPTVPADGKSVFSIVYTLFDVYGNPTNGQTIWVNTSINGEEKQFESNSLGQVVYTYGPRSTIGEIYITASSVANSTVISTPQKVKFKDTGAAIISLTANPSMMASGDVPLSVPSNVIATVADETGNAVSGTTVAFTLSNATYDYENYNVTAPPSLSSSSGITDADGQTTGVQFIPGSFTTLGNPGFNASATGHCNIIATWNGTTKTVPVTWKNYPYLSVLTSVEPLVIGVNQTVNVTIGLKGDGWALGPRPADVVIVTNLAGGVGGTDRLAQTIVGEKAFVDSADSGVSISLVSIGNNPTNGVGGYASANALNLWNQQLSNGGSYFQPYDGAPMDKCLRDPALWNSLAPPTSINASITSCQNYYGYQYFNPSSDAKLEMDFTTADSPANKAILENTIQNFNAFGGTNYAAGINLALKQFDKVKNDGHVKALIIMGDGITMVAPTAPGATDSYWPSDWYPRASLGCFDESDSAKTATWKAADIAKSQGIIIYVLGYPTYGSEGAPHIDNETINGMVTPGSYYYVPEASQMHDYFSLIYGQIRNESGVNTALTADFQNINVTGVSVPGAEVYSYVPPTKIGWQDGIINFTDQTSYWDAHHQLEFNIGTIKLKQQWNATFQLKVMKSGLIDVFGKDSTVTFNGGTQTLYLPQTFISVVPLLGAINITGKTITLKNLELTEPGEIKALLPVTWDTTYTGNATLTERVYYQEDNGPWVLFDTKTHSTSMSDPLSKDYTDFAQLDVTKLPPGGYGIKVVATASDAPDATITLDLPVTVGNQQPFIRLQ